jgi:hypothetical protein
VKARVESIEELELRRHRDGALVSRSFEVRGTDDYKCKYANQVPYELGIKMRVGQEFDFQTGELNGIEG